MRSLGVKWVRHAFQAGLLIQVVAISWLAFSSEAGSVAPSINDKVGHALAFFCLALFVDGAFPRWSFWKVQFPILAGYGVMIELGQSFLPYRDFSFWDMGADVLGIFNYLLLRSGFRRLRNGCRSEI
jgi:VanZ family protein